MEKKTTKTSNPKRNKLFLQILDRTVERTNHARATFDLSQCSESITDYNRWFHVNYLNDKDLSKLPKAPPVYKEGNETYVAMSYGFVHWFIDQVIDTYWGDEYQRPPKEDQGDSKPKGRGKKSSS